MHWPSDQTAVRGLQAITELSEHSRCGAAPHPSMESDTEVQLIEVAVIDPTDHVFYCSEVAIVCVRSIRQDAERADLYRLGRLR